MLINDPVRFDGVTVVGFDEHIWRHTRRGDRYVTVIIDLTGIAARPSAPQRHGPARLLDMIESPRNSRQAVLSARPQCCLEFQAAFGSRARSM